ncbi:hypothetical protein TorRG33x02_264730 [Trema orientale]|uniref:Uncharacterized protein n=1 Tax=Trema orientale TaxID=63057 RepID=A0A2P5D2A7_TREOI|nr:hypothetical protein TorRG33x02_264730 [Trema orientale]
MCRFCKLNYPPNTEKASAGKSYDAFGTGFESYTKRTLTSLEAKFDSFAAEMRQAFAYLSSSRHSNFTPPESSVQTCSAFHVKPRSVPHHLTHFPNNFPPLTRLSDVTIKDPLAMLGTPTMASIVGNHPLHDMAANTTNHFNGTLWVITSG